MREMDRLTPTNSVYDGSKLVATYTYRAHGEIAIDEFDGEVSIDGVEVQSTDDGLRWQYKDRTPVYVRCDGVYGMDDTHETRAQAYFALSYLDQEGIADMRSK